MAAAMFGPCYHANPEDGYFVRQVAPLPELVTRVPWQVFQDCLVRVGTNLPKGYSDFRPALLNGMPNNQLRGMVRRLTQRVEQRVHELMSPFDVWFDDELFNQYRKFFEFLLECTHGQPLQAIATFYNNGPIGERLARELRLETRGYQK
jgi:hypothetical protein